MNNKFGIVLLIAVCVGLGAWLVVVRNQAADRQHEDARQIDTLSNNLSVAQGKLDEEKTLNATLNKDLDDAKKKFESAITELTNSFTQVSSNLVVDDAALKASREDVAKRDAKIADLEQQNAALDKKASELTSQIADLNTQIAEKQKKLAASEGDKAFLEKELKKLIADKAELERQFNDLTVLRAQVAKVKEELNIARRLDWIRQGLYANADQKGAQRLMQGGPTPQAKAAARPNYDLNVEVGSDGSVHVIPPPTNSAAGGSAPGK
jgi:chromosome segregation ATPase